MVCNTKILDSLFEFKNACLREVEPPVVRARQLSWPRPGRKILSTRSDRSISTESAFSSMRTALKYNSKARGAELTSAYEEEVAALAS